jgi:hypothetical protein
MQIFSNRRTKQDNLGIAQVIEIVNDFLNS